MTKQKDPQYGDLSVETNHIVFFIQGVFAASYS